MRFDSTKQIVLFRGDADKIKEFDIKKTKKYCLVGQGIYLTDDRNIADSYRTKGASFDTKHVIFRGPAENRNEAMEKAFDGFVSAMWEKEYIRGRTYRDQVRFPKDPKEVKRYQAYCRPLWEAAKEAGDIKAEYDTTAAYGLFGHSILQRAVSSQRARLKQNLPEINQRKISVTWQEDTSVGFITEFHFDQSYIDNNTLHVDRPIYDPYIWSLFYKHNLNVGTPYGSEFDYIEGNKGSTISPSSTGTSLKYNYNTIANILKKEGIIGYEYIGGRYLGGGRSFHRAFCLWDDEFVNAHKVKRFR